MKQLLLDEMKRGIMFVVLGQAESYESEFLCANDFCKYIQETYNVERDDFDSNGWDYDFWIYYTIKGENYCVSGSGYYGKVKFSRN